MATQAMAFSKTSQLPDAAALTGDEIVRVIQSGGDTKLGILTLANAVLSLAKLTGLATNDASAVAGTDNPLVALGKIQAQLNKAVMEDEVGTAPNQVPVNQLLGRTAFSDVVGAVQVYRHKHASVQGDVWFEYVSDTSLKVNFHGMDNITRSTTLTLA